MSEAAALPRDDRETRTDERAGVVLVGQPNVGKSALFGALTGSYVTVSNYPGTTVEITTGSMTLGGRKIQVIDTPGAHSFNPTSEDERVTLRDLYVFDHHGYDEIGRVKGQFRCTGVRPSFYSQIRDLKPKVVQRIFTEGVE